MLAAVVSAALAVSTMAVSSVPVSAAGDALYTITRGVTATGNVADYPNQYVPSLGGLTLTNAAKIKVSYSYTVNCNVGGGGNLKASADATEAEWANFTGTAFSLSEGQSSGTGDWTIDLSGKVIDNYLQFRVDYVNGKGSVSITKVDFLDASDNSVGSIASPGYTYTVDDVVTGSTAITPNASVDYTTVTKVEIDAASSTGKGTTFKAGINQNAEGNWKDSGDVTVADGDAAWSKTATISGLNGVVPSELKVQFFNFSDGQVFSVNEVRFYGANDKLLETVTAAGSVLPTPDEPDEKTITLAPKTLNLTVGGNGTITATTTPAGETVTWTSSDPAVATVDGGVVTAVAAGTATITAAIDGETPAVSDTCAVTVTAEDEPTPDNPDDPNPPAPTDNVLWEGSEALGNWAGSVQIAADKFANLKDGDVIKVTFDLGESNNQISFKYGAEGWPALTGAEYIDVTASPYSYTIAAGDADKVKNNGLIVGGQNLTIKKVELVPGTVTPPTPSDEHHWATEWSKDETNHWHACTDADCTEKNDLAAHTFDNGEVTTPATATTAGVKTYTCTVCGQTKTEAIPATGAPAPVPTPSPAPSIPSSDTNMGLIGVAPAPNKSEPSITGKDGQTGWNAIGKEVADTSTGKVSVDMNSSTQLPKDVVETIKDTDVDLVLNLDNGITWTINGNDVTAAQTVDMDVTTNTRNIPKDAIKTATGKSSARQISLAHDGNFGFTAKMTISLGKVNNGQYANLFYYNPKTKALEFVDAGIIKNGKANLVFTHASDYAIVIDEEPLGTYEDVAAAAGITSSEEMSSNTVVYVVCGVSVLAILGVLISLKRRYQK